MNWKEKLEEKRQRDEANRYFHENNPEFFSGTVWLKLIATGLVMAVGCGVLYAAFVALTHLHAAYILGLLGVVIAKVLKKVAKTGNVKIAILTVIFYALSIFLSYGFYYAFEYFIAIDYGTIFNYLFNAGVWKMAMAALTDLGLLTGIIFFIGGVYAYQNALYD